MARKIVYANEVTYSVPLSLEALQGPESGVIALPRGLYWGPERTTDLTVHSDMQRTYQAWSASERSPVRSDG